MPEIAAISRENPVALILGNGRESALKAGPVLKNKGARILQAGDGLPMEAEAAFEAAVKQYERVDVAVAALPESKDAGTLADSLTALFNCCRAAAKVMVRQRAGRIINILPQPVKGDGISAAAHEAAVGLTRALARELAPRGVAVNALVDGSGPAPEDTLVFLALDGAVSGEVLAPVSPP